MNKKILKAFFGAVVLIWFYLVYIAVDLTSSWLKAEPSCTKCWAESFWSNAQIFVWLAWVGVAFTAYLFFGKLFLPNANRKG